MRVHPLIMACRRDLGMLAWLLESLQELRRPEIASPLITVDEALTTDEHAALGRYGATVWQRRPGFGQWGMPSSVIKLQILGHAARRPEVDPADYLWCLDCDVAVVSDAILDRIDGQADLYGLAHTALTPTTRFGPWGHVSGCCNFLRARVARRFATLGPAECQALEMEMRREQLCLNEDVVLTYAAQCCGATRQDLTGPAIYCDDLAGVLLHGKHGYSVVHYNVEAGPFGGHQIRGKWDVPALVRAERGLPA